MSFLQEWLEDFVEDVRFKWNNDNVSFGQVDYDDLPEDEIWELGGTYTDTTPFSTESDVLSNNQIGLRSEIFVQDIVENSSYWGNTRYVTTRTQNSETPSDVWGVKNYGNSFGRFLHLMLIQVKGTQRYEIPETLNEDKIDELCNFRTYVYNHFQDYVKPKRVSEKNHLVISCGYAGVKISKSNHERIKLVSTDLFDDVLIMAKKTRDTIRFIRKVAKDMHNLDFKNNRTY